MGLLSGGFYIGSNFLKHKNLSRDFCCKPLCKIGNLGRIMAAFVSGIGKSLATN